MVCDKPGGNCHQPVMFLGRMIFYSGVFCKECQVRLAGATRFLVETRDGGHEITPVDENNLPLLQRKKN